MSEITTGTVLDANGEPAVKPTVVLTTEEAELLRHYKQFLARYGLREALYCNTCWQGSLSDGMDVYVTGGQILFKCRHRMLFYQGHTF